ncbi:MAG: hypothetical protein K8T89_04935, partial [Planctomycetes bacterium]|nr:hypothetical protein [Planctomycetota bacterium]
MKCPLGMFAVLLLFAPATSLQAADGKASAVESLLTSETIGFLHVRVGEIWNAPSMAFYRKVFSQIGADEIKVFDGKYAPSPSNIEAVTIILPSTRNKPEMPSGHPLALTALWVVSTKEPIDRVDLVRALGPDGRTKAHRSTEYLF